MGPRLDRTNEISKFFFGLAALVVLLAVVLVTAVNFGKKAYFEFQDHRGSADGRALRPLDLEEGWEYVLVPRDLPLEQVRHDLTLAWRPFDTTNPTRHADDISGYYWLRNRFPLNKRFAHPSLVFGLVANYHRTYVNGRFVGGSDFWEHVAQYSIDSDLLRYDDTLNEIYIKAYTPKVFLPGITRLSHIGVVLGEFGDIQRTILTDTLQFFILRSVYLAVTFLTSLILLAFLAFNRSRKYLFYFSVYLLMGTLSLLYDNFYVVTALNYPFHRFLKIFAVGGGVFILSAAFWNLSRRPRLEFASNALGLGFALTALVGLLVEDMAVREFSARYRGLFAVAFWASVLWVSAAFFHFLKPLMPRWRHERRAVTRWFYQFMVLASGGLLGLVCLSSSEILYNRFETVDFVVKNLGITHSFFFSLLILGLGAVEHIRSLNRIEFEREKDRFNLELVRVLKDVGELRNVIHIIQEKTCHFVGCERSTIYLLDNPEKNQFLEADFIFGDHAATALVEKVIPTNQGGLIGRVIATRQPVLITDTNQEPELSGEPARAHYKTRSCMVVPLLLEGEFVGVLTMADKANGGAFTRRDLQLIEGVAKDLALICKIARLKTTLQRQLDGIIAALAKMIEKRDPYTEFHSHGVCYLTERLAREVGHPVTNELKVAAFLHDVGKVFVPKRVLNKPGPLNPAEREAIERHARWSQEVLKSIPGFEEIAVWAGLHHETIDGKGYPYGLTEDLIPFEAQIISVADFIDALATNRSYRPKYEYSRVEELLRKMGEEKRFDARLVEAGVRVIQSADFRKLYSERGASYRPGVSAEQVVVEYYLEPFEEFVTGLKELRDYLGKVEGKIPQPLLNSLVSHLRKVGNELSHLTTRVSQRLKEYTDDRKAG